MDDFIIYIDVQPGENRWAYLLQELQMRGIKIPILISIRDEDYNITSFNGKAVQYNVIELELTEGEAHWIYDFYTENQPHATFRTFEDAWNVYGGKGPLIEFVYLLTNNQTLTQTMFGYSLFWMAKRNYSVELQMNKEDISNIQCTFFAI